MCVLSTHSQVDITEHLEYTTPKRVDRRAVMKTNPA